MKREPNSVRLLEELLEATAHAFAQALARDTRLRRLLEELKTNGVELRVVLEPRPFQGSSQGFVVEFQHPWPRTWSKEDEESLNALGISFDKYDPNYPSS